MVKVSKCSISFDMHMKTYHISCKIFTIPTKLGKNTNVKGRLAS